VTKGGGLAVEADEDVIRVFEFQQPQKAVDHAKDGAGVLALGIHQRVGDKGEVGTVEQGRTVDQIEGGSHEAS